MDIGYLVDPYIAMLRYEAFVFQDSMAQAAAGVQALTLVDFNPDHLGWSVGVGVSNFDSYIGSYNAAAAGVQYGWENIALNIKGWQTADSHMIGLGAVIGF